MYCKDLLKRHKQSKIVFYCRHDKRYTTSLLICQNCLNKNLKRNKPIKNVSNKRIFVTEQTYKKVFERDNGTCRLLSCKCEGKIELHHIKYRSEAKDLINEPSNCICLCTYHHTLVHSNKHYWQPILKEMIKSDS